MTLLSAFFALLVYLLGYSLLQAMATWVETDLAVMLSLPIFETWLFVILTLIVAVLVLYLIIDSRR